MMISSKGRYALRVMIDLAEHAEEGYIPLQTIAARQGISEKYLESILAVLSKAKLLDAVRGKGGGYRLARPAAGYTAFEILSLTEGTLAPRHLPRDRAAVRKREKLPDAAPVAGARPDDRRLPRPLHARRPGADGKRNRNIQKGCSPMGCTFYLFNTRCPSRSSSWRACRRSGRYRRDAPA